MHQRPLKKLTPDPKRHQKGGGEAGKEKTKTGRNPREGNLRQSEPEDEAKSKYYKRFRLKHRINVGIYRGTVEKAEAFGG